MVRGLTIRGAVGQVKWAYSVAADLASYTVTRKSGAWTLEATVRSSNAFRLGQQPLTFVASHAKGEWRWPIQDVQLTAGRLSARLGPPMP